VKFRPLAILLFTLFLTAAPAQAKRPCLSEVLDRIVVQPVKKKALAVKTYGSEVRKDWKRLFIKDAELNAAKTAGYQYSWSPFRESPKIKWYWQALQPDTYFQLPSRAISKTFLKKSYDFVPVSKTIGNFETYVLKNWIKIPGKKLTRPVHFILSSVAFPLTGFGLASTYLYYKENQIDQKADPDYLIAFDQRFADANELTDYVMEELKAHPEAAEELKKETGLTSTDRESVLLFAMNNLNRQRVALSDYLQTVAKDGLSLDHPDALLTLSGDEAAIERMAQRFADESLKRATQKDHKKFSPEDRNALVDLYRTQLAQTSKMMKVSLFREADTYTSSDWLENPPENIALSNTKLTSEQKQKVYQIQLDLLHAKDLLYAHPSLKQRVKSAFSSSPDDPKAFIHHLKDPFIIDSLRTYAEGGKTDDDLIPYHASQYLDWAAKLEMLKVIGATQYAYEYVPNGTSEPDVRLTNQPMSLERAEKEILHDTVGAQNLRKKLIEYRKWKKKN
jgi:hypothetical protein